MSLPVSTMKLLLTVSQRILSTPALGDILGNSDYADMILAKPNRKRARIYPPDTSVRSDHSIFNYTFLIGKPCRFCVETRFLSSGCTMSMSKSGSLIRLLLLSPKICSQAGLM